MQNLNPQQNRKSSNQPYLCPKCGSEHVQSVAAISESGSWQSSSTTLGGFVGSSAGVDAYGGSTISQSVSSGSSNLAQTLAPPPKPWSTSNAVSGILALDAISFVISYCMRESMIVSAISSSANPGATNPGYADAAPSLMPLFLVWVPPLIVIVGTAIAWLLSMDARTCYPSRLANWRRLMYCNRCHSAYDPQTWRIAPAEQVRDLYW